MLRFPSFPDDAELLKMEINPQAANFGLDKTYHSWYVCLCVQKIIFATFKECLRFNLVIEFSFNEVQIG